MKKFLIKLLSLSTVFLSLLIVVFFFFFIIEKKINKDLHKNQSIAVLGHSHPGSGINDELLKKTFSLEVNNYGANGQSMFWSIIGGKKLRYQGVKCFIIEVTNNTYTTGWKALDPKRGLKEIKKKYFLNGKDWEYLFKSNLSFASNLLLQPSTPTKQIVRGRYIENNREFNNKVVKENNGNISDYIPDFDDRIIHDFIKENNSCLFILIRIPQHPKYYDIIGEENEAFYQKKLSSFVKYKNCVIMDFGNLFKEDKYFADLEHLNSYGADKFTVFLGDTILNTNIFKERNFLFKAPEKEQLN